KTWTFLGLGWWVKIRMAESAESDQLLFASFFGQKISRHRCLRFIDGQPFKDQAFWTLPNSAASGHLILVQQAHEHDCRECEGIAGFQAVHSNDCSRAMESAAKRGHLKVIKWFTKNCFQSRSLFAPNIIDTAARAGHLPVVEWLHAEHPRIGCTFMAMDGASFAGHLPVVEWLHAHRAEGCTSSALDLAAGNGHLPVAEWLHAHRAEGGSVLAMDLAAGNGHLPVVEWLHARRAEGCTPLARRLAAQNGHPEVAEWLASR
ncbi:unnamed protein product, partial [Heterosigma akashiwo]